MKNNTLSKKKPYTPPVVRFSIVEIDEGIAAASITPHFQQNGQIEETWLEEEITFDKIEW